MLIMNTELFHKICQGNEKAFNEAFDRHYPSLCYYTDKFLHDLDQSRSLVQQVFVDLWIKREKITINQSLQSYLFRSVRNSALDYIKHQKVEARFLQKQKMDETTYDRDWMEEAELSARINSAVNELPEKCREIFLLSRFEEMRYADIALKLDISVKTVEMQMGIAMKKLRLKLADIKLINLLMLIFTKKS